MHLRLNLKRAFLVLGSCTESNEAAKFIFFAIFFLEQHVINFFVNDDTIQMQNFLREGVKISPISFLLKFYTAPLVLYALKERRTKVRSPTPPKKKERKKRGAS